MLQRIVTAYTTTTNTNATTTTAAAAAATVIIIIIIIVTQLPVDYLFHCFFIYLSSLSTGYII
jgi:hypothetical protein